MSWQHWLTLASPFILGGAILGLGEAWEYIEHKRAARDRARREFLARRWGLQK